MNKKHYDYSTDLMNESDGSEITQITFEKDVPYVMDFTFAKYGFEKNQEHIKGYTLSEINRNYYKYEYIEMGLSESSLNTIAKPVFSKSL